MASEEPRMGITPQDWWVTANLEVDRGLEAMTAARTADLTMAEVVQTCWRAYETAAVAGALIEAELAAGVQPSALRDLLRLPTNDPSRALTFAREAARERLRHRLPGS
jgi:hypothetical protein